MTHDNGSERIVNLRQLLEREYGIEIAKIDAADGVAETGHVFMIEDASGTRLVAKMSLWYAFAQDPVAVLEKVYEVADMLALKGIPLQSARKKTGGGYVTQFEGYPLVLLRYIDGVPFSGKLEEFAAAGEALGRFHVAGDAISREHPDEGEDIRQRVPVEKPYEESRTMYEQIRTRLLTRQDDEPPEIAVARESLPLLDETIAYIDASLDRPLAVSILHNDFSWANGLYREDGSFSGFIDVEQLGVGPCIYDIANTLASLATEYMKSHSLEEFHAMGSVFLQAYDRAHPLPQEEHALLLAANQRWDVMRILRILRRHFGEPSAFKNPLSKMAKRFIPRLARASELFAFVTDEAFTP